MDPSRNLLTREFLPLLESLPFVITIQGKCEIVHAERVDVQSNRLLGPESFGDERYFVHELLMEGTWQDQILLGTQVNLLSLSKGRYPGHEKDLESLLTLPVFCGHMVFTPTVTFAGHTFLDPGAYKTGRLTLRQIA